MQNTMQQRPLVIGLPGSFDSEDYASYRSWLDYIPAIGADIRVLDMLHLPCFRQIGQEASGSIYYCDWQPEDYTRLIMDTIDELQPSKVVLLGFGSGVYEAIRSALALSMLGKPISGIVGIAPHAFTYTTKTYRKVNDIAEQSIVEAGLRECAITDILPPNMASLSDRLLSCVRYEDLRNPQNGSRNTFYMPQHVMERYRDPLREILITRVRLDLRERPNEANSILRKPAYMVPTAFIATADSWYLPSARVEALAHRAKRAPTSYTELPGIGYDFRAYPSQVDRVTEVAMDKIGQLLTTGTVHKPRPSRTLLRHPRTTEKQPMGTIVLSSARSPHHHRFAVQLAKESGTDLAVLVSHDMQSDIVATDMIRAGIRGCVIDMPTIYRLPLTADFATIKHPRTAAYSSNLSVKRNIGLIYGRLTGQKLFFLDDDIWGIQAQRLRSVAGHLEQHAIAGFLADLHPDNSVVCHANRLAGNAQQIFISGGSLGVDASIPQSFFPQIYNEDWLFCYDMIRNRKAAFLGKVKQLEYNPFDPNRAITEEFGDVLAEGLQYLLAVGTSFETANKTFWQYYLWRRRRFITDIVRRLASLVGTKDNQPQLALTALTQSRNTLDTFIPADFVTYIQAWRSDTYRWHQKLHTFPHYMPAKEALRLIADKTDLRIHTINI